MSEEKGAMINTRNRYTSIWRVCSNRSMLLVGLLLTATVTLQGCGSTSHSQEGEILGGVLGGVLGAQIGDGSGRTAAIIIGALAGSKIGKHIGEDMDAADRYKTAEAFHNNKTGQSTTWTNPDTGRAYTVTPTRTFENETQPCREFDLDTTYSDQRNERSAGTACLRADNNWVVK